MIQEQKDLLLKDLCARLPYGVKVQLGYTITSPAILKGINKDFIECDIAVCELEDIKPYLFPLSNMTEEQENEWYQLHVQPLFDRLGVSNRKEDLILQAKSLYIGTDWLNAHHFDYRGLIPMELAVDASGLNIY